jgi:hypothetical protein
MVSLINTRLAVPVRAHYKLQKILKEASIAGGILARGWPRR